MTHTHDTLMAMANKYASEVSLYDILDFPGIGDLADKNNAHAALSAAIAEVLAERDALAKAAYLAGFNASGEGYNGEYPFNDRNRKPTDDPIWVRDRNNALASMKGTPT